MLLVFPDSMFLSIVKYWNKIFIIPCWSCLLCSFTLSSYLILYVPVYMFLSIFSFSYTQICFPDAFLVTFSIILILTSVRFLFLFVINWIPVFFPSAFPFIVSLSLLLKNFVLTMISLSPSGTFYQLPKPNSHTHIPIRWSYQSKQDRANSVISELTRLLQTLSFLTFASHYGLVQMNLNLFFSFSELSWQHNWTPLWKVSCWFLWWSHNRWLPDLLLPFAYALQQVSRY